MDRFCCYISENQERPAESVMKIEQIKEQFPTVFRNTLGLCTKANIKLKLREGVAPIFRPKRPVAHAMESAVDDELNRLEKLGVITPTNFSEWAAPIVVVRKANGQIRICGDYSTGLNSSLCAHEYPLPLPDDIFAKLSGCHIFSKIDLSDAFLQVQIDEDYRHILTINTHRGLYYYNRLPPGIKVAPAAFQQLIDTMLAGTKRVCGYMDDLIIRGATEAEHERHLKDVLKRIEEYGFTIRNEKCEFKTNEIRYLGHVIDSQGLRPDPNKIAAIRNLPEPTNLTEIRSFLGAINYYGKFVPNMRQLRFRLDELLKHGERFQWDHKCKEAFDQFKKILSSNLLLTHYNPNEKIVVSADASSVGLGATLSHRYADGSMKVVQHASRALTEAEKRYSQIDREGLAIVYAVTKFHRMLYGRHFLLQTDHRPLLQIFGSKKGIPIYTANRLQRFALTLQLYDFEIEYVRTEQFGNADILYRLIKNRSQPEDDYVIASIEMERDVKAMAIEAMSNFPISFREIERHTSADAMLRKVRHYIQDGWPTSVSYGNELACLNSRKDALTLIDGCILFGERMVIPQRLRERCLKQLHQGHPGMQRMKSVARSYIY
uniref:uncharacterized protein K02A2.6-like n=1 Tax=Anopheles coluzzii TaxID=1518534 RepID=UPI0020FFAC57|nr:uncharacterized protein K02A2.6-like [Anopheles coluzzii]